jgi:hypothetical protein
MAVVAFSSSLTRGKDKQFFRRTPTAIGLAQFNASAATKKNPKQNTHLGLREVCCLFRPLGWAAWVSGDGVPPDLS